MAQFVTRHNRSRQCAYVPFLAFTLNLTLTLTLMLMLTPPVQAQDLRDPTKPPASILRSMNGIEEPADPVLQSVLIAPNRKLAIIDGQTIKLNGKFGNQILIKINETSVVLKRGKQLQTLNLHPDFSKKPSQISVQTK